MAIMGEQYRRVNFALEKLIDQGIVALPRWHKLLGVRNALEAQRDSVARGTFLTAQHKWVQFQLEGEELVFPKQGNVQDALRIKLEWVEEEPSSS